MFPKTLYFPNTPRIAIVEASTSDPSRPGPNYLAFLYTFDIARMLYKHSTNCTETYVEDVGVVGGWNNLDLSTVTKIKVMFDEYAFIRFFSKDNIFETAPFYEFDFSSVLELPAEPYVIFGKPGFIKWAREKVIPELEENSPTFTKIVHDFAGHEFTLKVGSIGA